MNRTSATFSSISGHKTSYRFSFNGKEKDDEISGASGSDLDFGARIYDSRLGRWLSVDPSTAKYPYFSPYVFAGNSPTKFVDSDGKDFGLLVDNDNHTIVVTATYYTASDAANKQISAALDQINSVQKSVVIDGQSYTVTFALKAAEAPEPCDDEIAQMMASQSVDRTEAIKRIKEDNARTAANADPQGNLYGGTVGNPTTINLGGKLVGGITTLGHTIRMRSAKVQNRDHPEFYDLINFGNKTDLVEHEVFHTLGLGDFADKYYPGKGIMTYTATPDNNYKMLAVSNDDIAKIIQYAVNNVSSPDPYGNFAKVTIQQTGTGDITQAKSITTPTASN